MLSLVIYLLAATLTTFYVIIPLRRYRAIKAARRFNMEYKYFKLKRIKKHYECLKDLSYEEIEQSFDISEAYNRIR